MLNFEEFRNEVIRLLSDCLAECEITPADVKKNNATFRGIVFKNPVSNLSPTIYLDKAFERYESGEEIESIVENIKEMYDRALPETNFDVSFFEDWDKVKNLVEPRLVKKEGNEEFLSDMPSTDFLDLAIIYAVKCDLPGAGAGSITVTNRHFEMWGITMEELHNAAFANAKAEAVLEPLENVLARMMGGFAPTTNLLQEESYDISSQNLPMMILRNERFINGASLIADNDTLAKARGVMGDDLIIIPSSVHEVILLPKCFGKNLDELTSMIGAVNGEELPPEDVLSDHPYIFTEDGLKIA